MEELSTTREAIGAAVGRIPSGCAILTAQHEGQSTGLLVSWMQQAAFEPLSITVAIKRRRPAQDLIDGSKRFLLNLIGEDASAMFKHFGKGFAPGEDAFAGLDVGTTEFGPQLPGCVAYLGCRVMQLVAVGDHDLYIAEGATGAVRSKTKPFVHIRKTGASY